jgi:hypothetical protein
MTLPVYAVWNNCVYPAIAISVVPGLSCVQKWRIRSPAVIPAGMLRLEPLPSERPTDVLCDDKVGYAGDSLNASAWQIQGSELLAVTVAVISDPVFVVR